MRFVWCLWLIAACGGGDSDGDGLSNQEERDRGTDPDNPDSDDDGITDGEEITNRTKPTDEDTDGDGLTDGEERDRGTNPRDVDSDADGLFDLPEITLGTDPMVADTDEDGLRDGGEIQRDTDPIDPDTDDDGLLDGAEIDLGTSPLLADSDGDGLGDGDELPLGTDPLEPDTDTDGFSDRAEVDSGSSPTNRYSWNYGGGAWPDRLSQATGVVDTGWGIGDTLPDALLSDQFGRYFNLHQFYGYVIRLDLLWAGDTTSEALAVDAESEWITHRGDGYIVIHAMFKRATVVEPITEVVPAWAAQWGLEFPVTAGRDAFLDDQFEQAGLFDGSTALTLLIDRDMVLRQHWVGGDLTGLPNLRRILLDEP